MQERVDHEVGLVAQQLLSLAIEDQVSTTQKGEALPWIV